MVMSRNRKGSAPPKRQDHTHFQSMSRSRFDRQDSALSTLALNAARSHRHVRLLREYVARRAFSVYKEYVDLHALTLLSGTKVTGTTLARDFRENSIERDRIVPDDSARRIRSTLPPSVPWRDRT